MEGAMAKEDILMLNKRDLKKLHVMEKVEEGSLKQSEAAELLRISERQVRRIVKRLNEEGAAGIAHRLRGRESVRSYPAELKARVKEIYQAKYKGFGPMLAAEKFKEIEGIEISDETLRKWLLEMGEWEKTRKSREHRQWRPRKGHRGEMVQMDGSHHDWYEGRGPKSVLMGYIDDATSEVYGRFYDYEGTMPAMDSFGRYIEINGVPMSMYVDRHTTYKSTAKGLDDSGEKFLSEYERALKEMGVELVHAYSPQAKGRVERLFRTFQDRVVKEMRLRGIKSNEEANNFLEEYLPEFNRKFSVKAREEGDLHRPVYEGMDIKRVLCMKTERVLRNDFTIAYENKLYQVLDKTKAVKVIMEKWLDGTLAISYKGILLKYKEIIVQPMRQNKRISRVKTIHKPAHDHPWRKGIQKCAMLSHKTKEV
jgi:transposase